MRAALFFVIVAGATVFGQTGSTKAAVIASLRGVLLEGQRQGLTVGFSAVDVQSGEVLLRSHADRLLVPASNMKIVTVAAALLGLGRDHRLQTDLIAHGAIEDQRLSGSLRLRGEGDPTLRAPDVPRAMADSLLALGIRTIEGDLLIDDRLFDQMPRGPAWPPDAPFEDFMAEVSALSLNHGTASVFVSAGRGPLAPGRCWMAPAGAWGTLQNRTVTSKTRREHLLSVVRKEDDNLLTVTGKIAPGTKDQEILVALRDPALVFAHALEAAMAEKGIRLKGRLRRPEASELTSGGRLLLRLETPVADILDVLMKASQNHRAEMLWKHLGACVAGEGSFTGGGTAARRVLSEAGIALDGAVFRDGSGLSRENLVTAEQLAQTLRQMWRSPHRELFMGSLPTGGEAGGTLRNRFRDLGTRVQAKTGSLRAITALSGYLQTEGGRTIAFSILVRTDRPKKLSARDLQDRMIRAMARLRDAP